MLIVFGGLPGTGKTTISRAVAGRRRAMYLRIDSVEQAIRDAGVLAGEVGVAGYAVANVVAEANLAGGQVVVVDCVNPVRESRAGWRAIAARAAVRIVEIELFCSDQAEHRRRVEGRALDVPGLLQPTWRDILDRGYEAWGEAELRIDTAVLSAEQAVAEIERVLGR